MKRGRGTLAAAALAAALALGGPAAAHAATGGVSADGGTPAGSTAGGAQPAGGSGPAALTGGVRPGAGDWRPPKEERKPERKRPRKPRRGQTVPGPADADVPRAYKRLYVSAAAQHGVNWRLLAAIGKNESDHGRSTAPGVSSGLNFANCCAGPMQICTVSSCGNVWNAYAVDGDRDGRASIHSPADSIHAAARIVRDLERMLGDEPKLLLAGYNAGPGNVQRYKGVPPFAETRAYVAHGLRYMADLRPRRG